MCRKLIFVVSFVVVLGMAGSTSAAILECDAGTEALQDGWTQVVNGLNTNVAGTGIDVNLATGNPDAISERAPGPGSSETLPDVERDLYFANDEEGSPGGDFILTLANLPAGDYILHSYHSRTDEDPTTIPGVTVTGATNIVVPDSIVQDDPIMDNPAEIQFTANGNDDVVIRYLAPEGGGDADQAFFNGFTLDLGVAYPRPANPSPSNNAPGVCPTTVLLSWTPTDLIEDPNHDFYLGTDYNDVRDSSRSNHPDGVIVSEDQDANDYGPVGLDLSTTYYWKVYEVNSTEDGTVFDEYSQVWRFTTEDGNAYDPDPPDGRRGVNPADVVLRWTPSCVATAQTVYFSTDFDDVNEMDEDANVATLSATDNNCPVGALDTFTTYYWRVKTTGGSDGEIWEFGTGLGGLLLEMLFEGTPDNDLPATVTDTSSNNLVFTKYTNVGSVKYGAGRFAGTSANFDPNAGLYRKDPCGPNEPDILRLDGYQYSIHFWVKPTYLSGTDMDDIQLVGKSEGTWLIQINDPGSGEDRNNSFKIFHTGETVSTSDDSARENDWVHIAVVYDQPDLDIYLNGIWDDSESRPNPPPADNNHPVGIGCRIRPPEPNETTYRYDQFLEGSIDELRIWDIVVLPELEVSSDPYPEDGSTRWDPNDANLATFMWTPGKYAGKHDIYFGDSIDDVNESADPCEEDWDSNSWTHNMTFKIGKTYYWRVDDVNGGDTYRGSIWRFSTTSIIEDPNMWLWYKFDDTSDDEPIDSSGHDYHGEGDDFDDDTWDPNDGRFPGCINMDSDQVIEVPEEAFIDNIGKEASVSVWVKGAYREDEDNWLFSIGYEREVGEDEEDVHFGVALPDDDSSPLRPVVFQAGNEANDVLVWTTQDGADYEAWLDNWHHFVFIKNENEGTMSIWFDAEEVAFANDVDTTSLADICSNADDFKIGAKYDHSSDFVGRIDDFRLYDYALPQSKIEELYRGGNVAVAWAPDPYDGESGVPCKVVLEWRPGNYASLHQVYFGTNWDDVNDANSTSHNKVEYSERSVTSYDPCDLLELEQMYYWRVDEVNEANDDTWKGKVWKFTVADYIGIDDMEKYTEGSGSDYPIAYGSGSYGWDCGGSTGSSLGLGLPSGGVPVRDKQSMVYVYDNTDAFYSEISNHFPMDPCDWTYADVKMLTLWFYGDTGNDADETEQMYVGLEDGDGNYAEVKYLMEDMNDIKIEEWQEWNIALSDFNDDNSDLTLTNIEKLYIGFGDRNGSENGGGGFVYFDDIRLYPPTCVLSQRPEEFAKIDFNNDCIVDFGDVKIMAEDWLKSDVNLGEVSEPCDANLVGWWMLDEGSGSMAYDSSDYHNDGTLQILDVNVSWVAGRNDVNCALEFSGGRVRVPNAQSLMPMHQVSACAWVYYSDEQDSARIVVKGADDKETYDLEVSENDELVFLVRDGNDYDAEEDDYEKYAAESGEDALGRDEWIHIAGTYDGNTVKCYINGELAAENNDPNISAIPFLSQDTNDLAIGNQPDGTDNGLGGTIDDVRVYNYGLSAAEVAYLATDGGQNGVGIFRMQSVANLYTGEPPGSGAVNLRDFAMLVDNWLQEEMWP